MECWDNILQLDFLVQNLELFWYNFELPGQEFWEPWFSVLHSKPPASIGKDALNVYTKVEKILVLVLALLSFFTSRWFPEISVFFNRLGDVFNRVRCIIRNNHAKFLLHGEQNFNAVEGVEAEIIPGRGNTHRLLKLRDTILDGCDLWLVATRLL